MLPSLWANIHLCFYWSASLLDCEILENGNGISAIYNLCFQCPAKALAQRSQLLNECLYNLHLFALDEMNMWTNKSPFKQGKCYMESYAGSWVEELTRSEDRKWHLEIFSTLNGAEQNTSKKEGLPWTGRINWFKKKRSLNIRDSLETKSWATNSKMGWILGKKSIPCDFLRPTDPDHPPKACELCERIPFKAVAR